MGKRKCFDDQTSIVGPIVENTGMYKPYILQNIEAQINYENTKFTGYAFIIKIS